VGKAHRRDKPKTKLDKGRGRILTSGQYWDRVCADIVLATGFHWETVADFTVPQVKQILAAIVRKNALQDIRSSGAYASVAGPLASEKNKPSAVRWFKSKEGDLDA
jgi:hypothetical protein